MKNMWELFLELRELMEDNERAVLRHSTTRDVNEKNRLGIEIDRRHSKILEIKHKLEKIEV